MEINQKTTYRQYARLHADTIAKYKIGLLCKRGYSRPILWGKRR